MPEYRRFISYFYEYIDGKKQRNTGFAKVELRNGVWRVLFRLTVPVQPGPPVEVFGFMREGEKLTGFPMGTMRAAREMTEEWAYRADRPVWAGKYGLSDISGLWIQSGDGRCFATVWDDEPVDPARFVKYEVQDADQSENGEDVSESAEEKEGTPEIAENGGDISKQAEDREAVPEPTENEGNILKQAEGGKDTSEPTENKRNILKLSEGGEDTPEPKDVEPETRILRAEPEPEDGEQNKGAQPEKVLTGQQPGNLEIKQDQISAEKQIKKNEGKMRAQNTDAGEKTQAEDDKVRTSRDTEDDRLWRDLYRKRAAFQPFSDQEISSCIRVVPGDIIVLQNARWRTGKNNFLLHGYHNYRHLLIGKNPDGGYVLGVPGVMNPQEKYMAAMFGFPDFKYADNPEGNAAFGYWCRTLQKENP